MGHPSPSSAPTPSAGDGLGFRALLTALVAFGPLSTDLYLPSLPSIARYFGGTAAEAQLTLSVFLLGFAGGMLVWGPLSDRFGRRPALLAGLGFYFVATIACAAAQSMEQLIAARFFQAVGACAGPVVARAVVRDVFEREEAARVLSYMAMAMGLAPMIGPVIGGMLEAAFGWRSNFVLIALIGAVALAATLGFLPETNKVRDPQAARPSRIAANFARLLSHRVYVGYVLTVALAYSGIFAFISGSSFGLIELFGVSPPAFGWMFAAGVAGYMAGAFISGRFAARVGLHRMIFLGGVVATLAGAAMTAFALTGSTEPAGIVAPTVVFLFGIGLMMANSQAGAITPFPRIAGAASALLGFVQMTVAAAVGVVVGRMLDESVVPMATAIFLSGLGALLVFRLMAFGREA
ncbi:MAG: multidrug effflux MFS transporter [Alphaproteobacteria bacterium]|nr:multidrug effflux MFS transporter [Alphaproteobacteria bacterium]